MTWSKSAEKGPLQFLYILQQVQVGTLNYICLYLWRRQRLSMSLGMSRSLGDAASSANRGACQSSRSLEASSSPTPRPPLRTLHLADLSCVSQSHCLPPHTPTRHPCNTHSHTPPPHPHPTPFTSTPSNSPCTPLPHPTLHIQLPCKNFHLFPPSLHSHATTLQPLPEEPESRKLWDKHGGFGCVQGT